MTHDPRRARAWQALQELKPVFDETPREYNGAGLTLDLTTAGMDANILTQLLALAEELDWKTARDDLLTGKPVNTSENRPALHTALRAAPGDIPAAVQKDVAAAGQKINAVMARVDAIRPVDIIHVGIGGSGLGPLFLLDYLQNLTPGKFRVHVISNADPATLQRIKAQCDPLRSIVIIASKSFATEDVMLVARHLAVWLQDTQRMFAVTAQPQLAERFGIETDQIVPIADWLGGRFSIWGGVSLPVLLSYGAKTFEEFLSGARDMDEHFRAAPATENLPLLFALAHIWQRNFMHAHAHAIVPYADALRYLPPYVQQLEMESNGKPAAVPTAPVVFGGVGTTIQHSFMQWLHQGQGMASTDFILPLHYEGAPELADFMRNNALAQSAGLAHGAPPHFPGGKPSNLISFHRLTPAGLGALLALYEYKTYLQAHVWGINCFDQPGVELGKRLAKEIEAGKIPRSTAARLRRYI